MKETALQNLMSIHRETELNFYNKLLMRSFLIANML